MFIVLEGIDGAGTTTASMGLARLLAEQTERRIVVTQEPTKGPIGGIIRQVLEGITDIPQSELLHLFLADRKWHVEHVIKPNLKTEAIVISDRYAYSTWCYQQILHPKKHVEDLINYARIEVPNIVFILEAPVELCLKRKGGGKDLFEKRSTLKEVSRHYKALTQGSFALGSETFLPIDSTIDQTEVAQTALSLLHLATGSTTLHKSKHHRPLSFS